MFASTIQYQNLVAVIESLAYMARGWGWGREVPGSILCSKKKRFIVEDEDFPREIERVVASAFLQTDNAFAEACSLDAALASGTTALAALVVGKSGIYEAPRMELWAHASWNFLFHVLQSRARINQSEGFSPANIFLTRSLVVANAGDCRAVLCRRGKAIEMSRDHKPVCSKEKKRIEACGGYVYDGYLNGQLNVARALGDWHMEGLKDVDGGP
ncbi:putative protein phosphatase 2C 57 [Vitis vinifera]|uniref:PPM-type phosphatase domain-containing protein n=1 Tax=Vitis vinifera TaxID=29760 RepID=A0A438F261_VITVI|nr:putative protein phosphatase 2C 57 [Vitis vinifera]